MNIYFLCYTPLKDVDKLTVPPKSGDVICYIRPAQDVSGTNAENLTRRGIKTIYCEQLLTDDITARADEIGDRFLKTWFIHGEKDLSDLGNLSLGTSYGYWLALTLRPRTLLRIAFGFRELVSSFNQATTVFSDAQDGRGIYESIPSVHPLAKTLSHIAEQMDIIIEFLAPVDAIPSAMYLGLRNNFWSLIKGYLGSFRPSWLRAIFTFKKNRRNNPDKPVFYMFLGRAHELIAKRITKHQKIHFVCSQLEVPGTDAVRCDHLFALPSWNDIKIVRKLLKTIKNFPNHSTKGMRFQSDGINYDKILYSAVAELLQVQIWAFLIVVAQTRKFQKFIGASGLLINEACNEPMGNLVMLNRHSDLKIYLAPHGMNQTRYTFITPAIDNPHVTYLAFGSDYQNFFHSGSEDSNATRQVLVGNPLTSAMNGIRHSREPQHKKRLLILEYCISDLWSSIRFGACDRYYIEIFGILRELAEEGWTISYRPHPGQHHDYEYWLAKSFGVESLINWDSPPELGDSLIAHDVVVSNRSSVLYQSLYAGWPTIFYEPDYRNSGSIEGLETDPMFTSLQTAIDIDRPVTNDPKELLNMIRSSVDPNSMVSKFPERFAGELSHRFIGPDPAHSDKVIADFLENDFLGNNSVSTLLTEKDVA